MKVLDVLKKYHKQVPFPLTPAKIKRAGLNPTIFLIGLGRDLAECEDATNPVAVNTIKMLGELEILG